MNFKAFSMFPIVFVLASGGIFAADQPKVITPKNIKWVDDTEPGAPKGLKVAVLYGDPEKKEPYVLLVKFPPNSSFPLHSHSGIENVTIINGTFNVSFGSHDKSKGRKLPPGSFFSLPANATHYVWAGREGATVQITGIGPDETNLVGSK